MPEWVPLTGVIALIGLLYVAKTAVLRQRPSVRAATAQFATLLLLAVPLVWATDHDWANTHWYPIAHWVGGPVGVLAVPAGSFAADLWTMAWLGRLRSVWWAPLEVFVLLPAWFVGWTFFSFYVLDWGWI